ncbi:uncharacterized protein LOC133522231 isoform X1 [Cydia pomonella]|uniref:uncharacterized protein LOC133522231 isoform X1 n=1 Tax=Cydia pomonella TaxID=82600 RepID=UPI002ADE2AAB|nr:uncharacterized protein LOC133522231 isoform X1 [Cydia pomonella]XP_061713474.1 uncharacterized protein LOC133522231 isoform X1 [Cydia pomonella]XP_061713476.1 uncharacterized protein LOC133522231 isoform X1 [Cydia pomonella]
MSDLKEHRPLLRDDISDEEVQQEFRLPRRHMGYRGKARNTVKGAAAVIKNWPDYWLSSVTYWWIGIGMFALMTFVLYSSVVTYSLLPTTGSTPIPRYVAERKNTLPEVFMHVIVNNEKEVDFNKYLPYVEIIANKYLHYQFNLIYMLNDTLATEISMHQAQINNEDAMNSIWAEHNVFEADRVPSKIKSNIIIQHASLSNYLDGSPIQHYWKQLPNHLIGFFLRAVSIWDKGGIAFNPIILTPRSPDAIYIEKLYSLLSTYEERKKPNATTNMNSNIDIEIPKASKIHKRKYNTKKVNNIRDIIDALETDIPMHQNQPEVLSEAEDRQDLTNLEMAPSNIEVVLSSSYSSNLTSKSALDNNQTTINHSIENNQSKISNYVLPYFLDFLFHDKSNRTTKEESADLSSMKRSTRTISTESTQGNVKTGNVIQPMIISAPTQFEKMPSNIEDNATRRIDVENLTIDLKGNILATKSSCHAFLGSVFSNAKHGTEEDSLKEFIITELSLFCNGLLSTCKGIDVILL